MESIADSIGPRLALFVNEYMYRAMGDIANNASCAHQVYPVTNMLAGDALLAWAMPADTKHAERDDIMEGIQHNNRSINELVDDGFVWKPIALVQRSMDTDVAWCRKLRKGLKRWNDYSITDNSGRLRQLCASLKCTPYLIIEGIATNNSHDGNPQEEYQFYSTCDAAVDDGFIVYRTKNIWETMQVILDI